METGLLTQSAKAMSINSFSMKAVPCRPKTNTLEPKRKRATKLRLPTQNVNKTSINGYLMKVALRRNGTNKLELKCERVTKFSTKETKSCRRKQESYKKCNCTTPRDSLLCSIFGSSKQRAWKMSCLAGKAKLNKEKARCEYSQRAFSE